MWLLLVGAWTGATASDADPPTVTLTVAVPREAGSVYAIAVDGAAGQCTVAASALHCPAVGPVTFRWGPCGADAAGCPWALTGDRLLAPGEVGSAILWASEEARAADRERLGAGPVTPALVADLFVRTAENPVPTPSAGLFADLLALAAHPDPKVRREVVEALVPYWRHTASDPFPADAPPVLPDGLLSRLGADPDRTVRRRLAARLREAVGEPVAAEAMDVLFELSDDGGGVQRAAFASLSVQARKGEAPALATWRVAMERVTTPGPPGRAAAGTLAALAAEISPGEGVDPDLAVRRTAAHHLERTWAVWRAWRAWVPFDAVLAERLLRESVGLSQSLIRSWADDDPSGLLDLLRRWEPRAPHSERYGLVVQALADHPDERLRALVDDILSAGAGSPEPP